MGSERGRHLSAPQQFTLSLHAHTDRSALSSLILHSILRNYFSLKCIDQSMVTSYLISYIIKKHNISNGDKTVVISLIVGVEKNWFGTECDICMDFDTNEYPNIFVPRK